MQYWAGDQARALQLARFIADLQSSHSEQADFMFSRRFDCPDESQGTVDYVSRKFNVHILRCPRRGQGWPGGCNELALGTLENIYHRMESGRIPHYRAVFLAESDCCPLHKDWIALLSTRWEVLARDRKICIAGAFVQGDGIHLHINGSAMVSTDLEFLKWLTKMSHCRPGVGWDYCLAKEFERRGWAAMPGMQCHWHSPPMTERRFLELLEAKVIFHHGDKSEELLKLSRKHLL